MDILKLKVGSTFNATFNENISHGTSGVPLKDVTKLFIIPIINVKNADIYKLFFNFPVIK